MQQLILLAPKREAEALNAAIYEARPKLGLANLHLPFLGGQIGKTSRSNKRKQPPVVPALWVAD